MQRLTRTSRTLIDRLARLHGDQSGSISITSVFAILLLAYLLGMVMNSGRQVDQKIKMQNAADASTYSGCVVISRSMNTLAFTNHLLCDVFALTAFLREARDGNAARLTSEVLANWNRVSHGFEGSEFPDFAALAPAIRAKVPQEAEMIRTYSAWVAASSEMILPVLEEILATRAIPEYQRALTATTPEVAQFAADEVARRHGGAWPQDTRLRAVMWRSMIDPVGGASELERRTLPVVDPVMDTAPNQESYFLLARAQRKDTAHRYLRQWNNDMLLAFDQVGKMSQFSNLWRVFTCGQLEQLLNVEYPDTNLPHLIRHTKVQIANYNEHLDLDFMFVGVVYREKIEDRIPGVFRNRIHTDTQAYAQGMVFVPKRRLLRGWRVVGGNPVQQQEQGERQGGVPGEIIYLPLPDTGAPEPPPSTGEGGEAQQEFESYTYRQPGNRYAEQWDLLNQNWTTQIVPATLRTIPAILSKNPEINGVSAATPDLSGITEEDFLWLSNH